MNFFYRPNGPWCVRAAARSCSVVPPQMPWICSVRSANARHSRRTRQVAQIALAAAACSRAGPQSEIGKNSSGSADRQAATDRHCPRGTSHVVTRGLAEAMGGTVEPEETAGGGLTMVVSLPATPARPAAPVGGRRTRAA